MEMPDLLELESQTVGSHHVDALEERICDGFPAGSALAPLVLMGVGVTGG